MSATGSFGGAALRGKVCLDGFGGGQHERKPGVRCGSIVLLEAIYRRGDQRAKPLLGGILLTPVEVLIKLRENGEFELSMSEHQPAILVNLVSQSADQ